MKVITTQENLKSALSFLSRIPTSSVTLPVLQNILLKVEGGVLFATATNLEIAVVAQIRGKVEEEGEVLVQTKLFSEIINQTPKENIVLASHAGGLEVSAPGFSVTLRTSSEEFPGVTLTKNTTPVHIPGEELSLGLSEVTFAASSTDTQPELSGVLFTSKSGKLVLAATDRYRLVERVLTCQYGQGPFIVPLRAAQEIMRASGGKDGDVSLFISEHQLVVELQNGVTIATSLVSGEFPEYEAIIPKSSATVVTLDRLLLSQAVKGVSVLTTAENLIKLEFSPAEGKVLVSSGPQELGTGLIEVPCTGTGEKVETIFNYRYITDALSSILSDKLVFLLTKGDDPVMVKKHEQEGYIFVVMPIRQ